MTERALLCVMRGNAWEGPFKRTRAVHRVLGWLALWLYRKAQEGRAS